MLVSQALPQAYPEPLPISTRDLTGLPSIESLVALHQTLAALDATLCPEWEFRYFSFNQRWEPGEQLGLMRNGEGDDWLMYVNQHGVVLKGYVHTCDMAKEAPRLGLFDSVPRVFESFLDEPAFLKEATTFCIWRLIGDSGWHTGEVAASDGRDADGSEFLLGFLDGRPETYRRWAAIYFDRTFELEVVDAFYRHVPLDRTLATALNPEVDLDELRLDLDEIGYPMAE